MMRIQKKQKQIIIFVVAMLILFMVFNYKVFLGIFYNILGNNYYQNEDFDTAFGYHLKALHQIEKPELLYNLGNDSYKIGDKLEDKTQKIELYKQALSAYEKSLGGKKDILTQENYEFVKKKLEELDEPKKDESKEDEKQDEKNKEQEKKKDEANNEGKDGLEQPSDQKEQGLSEQEKKDLEGYMEELKKSEQQNQQFFNKQPQQGNENDFFLNPFLNDPFFENVFNRGGEKDW